MLFMISNILYNRENLRANIRRWANFQCLKKNVPFIWDEIADKYFDALKNVLTHALLLHLPNYQQDYFLCLATSDSTIGMVLVQEDVTMTM